MRSPFLLLALALVLSACSDALVSQDSESLSNSGERELLVDRRFDDDTASKFRNAHLMDRAISTDEIAGKDEPEPTLGLVVKISEQAIMERYAILERYKLMERYRLMERYEYEDAFVGFAVEVADTTGESEFAEFLGTMAMDPDIEWFEPDFGVESPDGSTSGQKIPWSIVAVGGHISSTVSGDGQGSVPVDVYVLDTGVSNPDLNIVESVDFTGHGTGDADGHGTHVAGILAAVDDNQGLVGIAPGARVHDFKVLGDDGTADVSMAIAAMDEIISRKLADPASPIVVNMSLGENIGTTSFTALDTAVQQALDLGIVVIVASGNQGVDAGLVTPAHVPDAITVGAFDQEGYLATFTNYGPMVDILAPGTEILSLKNGTGVGAPTRMTGTSMAAPHVAGGAALILSANPAATPAEVRGLLLASALPDIRLTGSTTNLRLWVGDF